MTRNAAYAAIFWSAPEAYFPSPVILCGAIKKSWAAAPSRVAVARQDRDLPVVREQMERISNASWGSPALLGKRSLSIAVADSVHIQEKIP